MTDAVMSPPAKYPQPALIIGLVILFMVVFSSTFLFGKSLRLDETQSLWQTSHSIGGVLRIIAQDVHLPLYFLMLRAWETVFGANALAIRSFSFLALVAAVPVFFAMAKEAYSRNVAIITVLLVGTSPFLLWYGSEGRMYTLLLLFTVLNQLAFMKLWSQAKSNEFWGLYALTAALGAMTHYFFFFVLAVQVLFYLMHRPLFPRRALGHFALVIAIVALECVVWMWFRTTVGRINADPFLPAPTSIDVFNVFSNFFIGFQPEALNSLFLSLWPLFVLGVFTLLSRARRPLPATQYLLMSAFLPIVLALIVSLTIRPLFLSRYLIIALPALYILVANAMFVYKKQVAYVLAGALILFMQGALFVQALSPADKVDENYREVADYIETRAKPEDLVVVSAPFTRYPMEYYYSGQARLATFPVWERYLELPAIPDYSEADLAESVVEWQSRYTTLYVVTSYDQGYEEELRLYLDHHLERIEAKEFSPGLSLYVYRLRYL